MSEFNPGECRRAAALLAHAAVADIDGMASIWADATEHDSCHDLLAAVVALVFEIVPGLRSEQGVAALRQFAATFAESEAAGNG